MYIYVLAAPPYINQTDPLITMHDLGSTFRVPCGIVLGPLSRTKTYDVEWQRLENNGTRFTTISSCVHTDLGLHVSPEQHPGDCKSYFNTDDFSLTIHNFNLTSSEVKSAARAVEFKCVVEQTFKPSLHITTHTIVHFRYGKIVCLGVYIYPPSDHISSVMLFTILLYTLSITPVSIHIQF